MPNRPETYGSLAADSAEITALRGGLEGGGRVWTALSLEALPLFTRGATLAKLAGRNVGDAVPLPRTTALEKFAGSDTKQAIAAATLRKTPLHVPRLDTEDAVVDVAEGDLPLVARRAVGLGSLVVTSFRPDHAVFESWSGRNVVVKQLLVRLGLLDSHEADANFKPPNSYDYGYNDLAGQLRSALDQYEGVQVVSFLTLALMVLGYLLLIGPVDYLLVRRVFKRPELTWITFPTIVVVTSLGAYYLTVWLKGEELRVSQADVIDCDAATGTIRSTSWAGVFSPVGREYDVRFETSPKLPLKDVDDSTSWFGLPGQGFGGMHAGGGAATWFGPSYTSTPDDRDLANVPIQVWSSKMFVGQRTARSTETLHEPIEQDVDGRLRGTLRNPFPFALKDVMICSGSRAYLIGTVEPKAEHDLASFFPRDIQSLLQDWHVVLSASKNPLHVGTPHDPGSLEVDNILRKMMFYAAAGGRDHANLEHRYQSFLDLSPLLTERRALLLGEIDPEAAGKLRLAVAGAETQRAADRRVAYLRLVIPIEESAAK
jgi:hypothetical protein